MQLNHLRPNMVYALTSNDRDAASSNYGGTIYATTGPELTLETTQATRYRPMVKRAAFYPVEGVPAQYSDLAADGIEHSIRTIRSAVDKRRGLSIRHEVCKLSEWPTWLAQRIAQEAEARNAREAARTAHKARQQRLADALVATSVLPTGVAKRVEQDPAWVAKRVNESLSDSSVEALCAALEELVERRASSQQPVSFRMVDF